MSAGAHFEEKGTIYFVLLGSKDTRQVLGHDEYSLSEKKCSLLKHASGMRKHAERHTIIIIILVI